VRAKLDISLADREEEERSGSSRKEEAARKENSGKINVTIFSAKMGALKDLIQAEKLNSSALHLQLTAQSQTDVKKGRASLETEFAGRVKRARRD
jgi:menin